MCWHCPCWIWSHPFSGALSTTPVCCVLHISTGRSSSKYSPIALALGQRILATAGRDTEQTDLKAQNPHCPQRPDLVLCGHSFGVSVARSFAQHLEVLGVRLRGLIAFDQRIRTALDLLPAFPQSHHFSASFCRLSSVASIQLGFSAALVPFSSLPSRGFHISSRMAADSVESSQRACHLLDTDHYSLPKSHAWDVSQMICKS